MPSPSVGVLLQSSASEAVAQSAHDLVIALGKSGVHAIVLRIEDGLLISPVPATTLFVVSGKVSPSSASTLIASALCATPVTPSFLSASMGPPALLLQAGDYCPTAEGMDDFVVHNVKPLAGLRVTIPCAGADAPERRLHELCCLAGAESSLHDTQGHIEVRRGGALVSSIRSRDTLLAGILMGVAGELKRQNDSPGRARKARAPSVPVEDAAAGTSAAGPRGKAGGGQPTRLLLNVSATVETASGSHETVARQMTSGTLMVSSTARPGTFNILAPRARGDVIRIVLSEDTCFVSRASMQQKAWVNVQRFGCSEEPLPATRARIELQHDAVGSPNAKPCCTPSLSLTAAGPTAAGALGSGLQGCALVPADCLSTTTPNSGDAQPGASPRRHCPARPHTLRPTALTAQASMDIVAERDDAECDLPRPMAVDTGDGGGGDHDDDDDDDDDENQLRNRVHQMPEFWKGRFSESTLQRYAGCELVRAAHPPRGPTSRAVRRTTLLMFSKLHVCSSVRCLTCPCDTLSTSGATGRGDPLWRGSSAAQDTALRRTTARSRTPVLLTPRMVCSGRRRGSTIGRPAA